MTWPYPGDHPLTRARRVANAYRAALSEVDEVRCKTVDDMMTRWGQHWAVPRIVMHAPDDWISAIDAAELASVDVGTVRDWRRRGRLEGVKRNGKWEYRYADVLGLSATARKRNAGVHERRTDLDDHGPVEPAHGDSGGREDDDDDDG